jgi:hypothetical protein
MPNGKLHDHPLTDILHYKVDVYGAKVDDLIRKIAELCSFRELDEWWSSEIGWKPDKNLIEAKARNRLNELLNRCKTERLGDTRLLV